MVSNLYTEETFFCLYGLRMVSNLYSEGTFLSVWVVDGVKLRL